MKKSKLSQPHDVLHQTDKDRIIEGYSGVKEDTTLSSLLISIFFFVVTTWAAVFLLFETVFPKVDGSIELRNLPYYIGLLGVWVLYTVNYSYFFFKKAQSFISGRISSVGGGLIIQSFVYAVMATAIAVKHFRSIESVELSSLLSLRIPLIDNPLNIFVVPIFLFALGTIIVFFSLGAKTYSGKERMDKLMLLVATGSIYAFTVFYNVTTQGWNSEFILTSAVFTAIIMLGIIPYVYANSIFCGAESSKTLNKTYYSSVYGGIYFVLLFSSYRLSKDLFILMHEHDSIDFFNYSLIFVAAIFITAFTRVLMYPRLLDEYNSDVLQTRRINDSNKGIMSDDDYIPGEDDDFEEGLSNDDFEEGLSEDDLNGDDRSPEKKKAPSKSSSLDYDDGFSFESDNEIDGIMEDD